MSGRKNYIVKRIERNDSEIAAGAGITTLGAFVSGAGGLGVAAFGKAALERINQPEIEKLAETTLQGLGNDAKIAIAVLGAAAVVGGIILCAKGIKKIINNISLKKENKKDLAELNKTISPEEDQAEAEEQAKAESKQAMEWLMVRGKLPNEKGGLDL